MRPSSLVYYTAFAAEKSGLSGFAENSYRFAAEKLGDPDAWFRLGRQAFQKGAWVQAATFFGNSSKLRPDHAESHFKTGLCLLKQSKWVEAEAAISTAIKLDPGQAQWRVQHQQVLEKIGTAPSAPQEVYQALKDISGLVGVLKSLTLGEDFASFDTILQTIHTTYGQDMPALDARLALMELERFAAAGLHDRGRETVKQMLPDTLRSDIGKGLLAFSEGRYKECVNRLEGHGDELIRDQPAVRLFARAARFAGLEELGLSVILEFLDTGGDSITWKEASLLVKDRKGLNQLLRTWDRYRRGRKTTPHLLKVAGYVAAAALRADNTSEAERIQCSNILLYGKKKTTRPPALFDPATHPDYQNLPLMTHPLKGVSIASLERVAPRYFRALGAVSSILESKGINHSAIRRTVAFATLPKLVPGLDDTVDIGVIGADRLDEVNALLHKSPDFHASANPEADGGMISFQHANGITLRIFLMKAGDGAWTHGSDGVEWKNRIFQTTLKDVHGTMVRLPEDAAAHLAEFTEVPAKRATETDYLVSDRNTRVSDSGRFIFHLRSHLIHLMASGDEEGVLRCVHKLSDLGDTGFVREFHGSYPNYVDANLPQLLKDKPQVILYLSGLEDVAYQGNMWIPVLEKLDARCAIAIRERRIAPGLLPTSMPVYYFDSMRDLEFMEECGVRTILYPANTAKNTNSLRFFKINHFFINHGESDKVVNQSKFLMAYDKLLVAGPLAERRLREAGLPVRNEQVVHVGRPQTELLLKRADSPSTAPRRILFAPTWEGFVEEANYASINEYGLRLLTTLAADGRFKVAFKPHPYTGKAKPNAEGVYLKRMTEAANKSGVQIIPAGRPIFDCMNDSDLMITDVSSVLNDYLYTLKPMILTNPRGEEHDSLRANFPSSAATYVLDQGEDIVKLIDRIAADDFMFAKRREVCADSLGEFPEGSLARFNRVVNESLAEPT